MTAEIRGARADEADALAALGAQTFTTTFGHLYSRANLEKFLAKNHSPETYRRLLADPRSAVWVAEDGGELVGYAVAGPCTLPVPDMPENAGELARLYVERRAQGAGLGPRLLDAALEHLRKNFAYIFLSVYRDNTIAQRVYERAGFRKVHEYFYMVGDHADPEYIMQLDPS